LKREVPFAVRKRDDESMRSWTNTLLRQIAGHKLNRSLPLDIQATAFQRRVWTHLQSLPFGATQSYREVAKAIGQPNAARAVARACASNRLAVAIPCHRVVREDGEMGGYRWGVERKRALLQLEQQGSENRSRASSAH
jgi:AraC family transcriptional regulator of adaptative response/methylated-DNA-[protein]-cysteine methyltransferase